MPRHHHWPVTMQAGGVVLRPMRRADEARWTTTRELDCDWLGPWEATKPPGSHERVGGYRMMITRNRRRAKEGTFLPWAIGWDDGWPDSPALNPRHYAPYRAIDGVVDFVGICDVVLNGLLGGFRLRR